MSYELGIIATLHLMEIVLKENHLCLSWDATTVEGRHVNEIHLTANRTQCLILDVRHLPGGTTADYVSHIMGALSDASATHAKFSGTSQAEVLTKLKASISATLTDRAAVNGSVTRQLCTELDSQILALNCNVHSLDGVVRCVKSSLNVMDTRKQTQGLCYGKEGCAGNLIKAISVLRFKDGTGDPVGFKAFLRKHNLPVGTFPRYVGNRLHILFHLAGLVILHEEKLTDFIEKECTAAAVFRSNILKDIKNSQIMVQVWGLAVIGKIFTGPWMTKFYSSDMSNLEMERRIKAVREIIRILRVGSRALLYVWALEQELNKVQSKYINSNRQKKIVGRKTEESNAELNSLETNTSDVSDFNLSCESKLCSSQLADNCGDSGKVQESSSHPLEPSAEPLQVHLNRTQFQKQDMLVPWQLKCKPTGQSETISKELQPTVFHRYYHVFKKGELESLCQQVSNCSIGKSYYDQGNWCVVIEKTCT